MEKGSTPLLTSLQPDQAGFRDPKQALKKENEEKTNAQANPSKARPAAASRPLAVRQKNNS